MLVTHLERVKVAHCVDQGLLDEVLGLGQIPCPGRKFLPRPSPQAREITKDQAIERNGIAGLDPSDKTERRQVCIHAVYPSEGPTISCLAAADNLSFTRVDRLC